MYLSPKPRVSDLRASVVAEALSYLRTPYHHAGRVKGSGVDCGQFLALVYEAAGVVPPIHPEPYPPDWALHRAEERYLPLVEFHAQKIVGPPEPGDIVLYRFGRCISHGAIVVDWPQIIHAERRAGCVALDDGLANVELRERQVGFWSVFPAGHDIEGD